MWVHKLAPLFFVSGALFVVLSFSYMTLEWGIAGLALIALGVVMKVQQKRLSAKKPGRTSSDE